METGHNVTATKYSPDGRIPQIEYAAMAVSRSFTIIGMRGKDCVVLAANKIHKNSFNEPNADERILTIENNIGMAMAGYTPDGLIVADVARKEAARYRQTYKVGISLQQLTERVSRFMHASTVNGLVRPLGMSPILTSWDEFQGPQMFRLEPCGSFLGYYACANGRAKSQVMREFDMLENISDMETEELVKKAGEIIYKCHFDMRNRDFRFEMGIVGRATGGVHLFNPAELTKMARAAGEEAAATDSSSSDDPFF